MQEIFRVGPLLDDAVTAIDLSALFDPGAVPKKPKCLVYEWLGNAQNSPPCIPARRAER